MSKSKTNYSCSNCGATYPGWLGRCPGCGEWNTLIRQVETIAGASTAASSVPTAAAIPLHEVAQQAEVRLPVYMSEVERVLGGGLVPGSVVLLAGEPGIGKSTLVLQMAMSIAQSSGTVLYVSGEESARQVSIRAHRIGDVPIELYILSETSVEAIVAQIERLYPTLTIVDSIQAVRLESRPGSAGSVVQVRDGAAALARTAKVSDMPLIIIGHVTKTGSIAGPRVLEHLVDTVLYMEGDRYHAHRILRSVKNRYGSTNEVGVFEMTSAGLEEVGNPSEAFLAERLVGASGSAVAVTLEGSRPILVEVQALTSRSVMEQVRRTANGFDYRRLLLLTAVLSRRAGLRLGQYDVFVNVVGGLQLGEPAADLAVAMAIASAAKDRPLGADMAFCGEIGLSGEVRSVSQIERRTGEAARLGFKTCLVPRSYRKKVESRDGCTVTPVRSLREALEASGLS